MVEVFAVELTHISDPKLLDFDVLKAAWVVQSNLSFSRI